MDESVCPHCGHALTEGAAKSAGTLIEKIKDNIAYVLGLPAAVSGAFGFLWQFSSGDVMTTFPLHVVRSRYPAIVETAEEL